jgi:alcohol oxidase
VYPGWLTFSQLETYHGKGEKDHHGYNGPIHVSDGTFRASTSEDDFIKATSKVGWPEISDLQSLDANNGIGRWLRYVSPDGKRQDTAHTYLHPKLQDGKHPHLHVLVESKVLRVLFDENKRAVGVEYTSNPDFQAATGPLTVKARKLVVVSCGACGTPSVLERSGLGDPEVLKRAGVPVVVDLPGVGHEYQDHNASAYPYKTNLQSHETINGILSGRVDVASLIEKNDKILGWNAIDIAAKLRPIEADITALGPEFQAAWDRDFKHTLDKPLTLMGLMSL